MIQKKTIKKESGYITQLYYYPKMRCRNCGEDTYGKGIIKVDILSKTPTSIDASNGEVSRVSAVTDTGLVVRLSMYNSDIIPSIGFLNTPFSEESREMVDMHQVSKNHIAYSSGTTYNHLKNQTLDAYLNDDSRLECPECKYHDATEPGYEVTLYPSPIDGVVNSDNYLRECYYTGSENGFNINDVSILVQHLNDENLDEPIEHEGGFVLEEDCKDRFEEFIAQEDEVTSEDLTVEW